MNFEHNKSGAVIDQGIFDQLHADDQKKFSGTVSEPTHGLRDYHVLFPLKDPESEGIDIYDPLYEEIRDSEDEENDHNDDLIEDVAATVFGEAVASTLSEDSGSSDTGTADSGSTFQGFDGGTSDGGGAGSDY